MTHLKVVELLTQKQCRMDFLTFDERKDLRTGNYT